MRIYWIKDSKTNWRQRMVCWLEINCSSSGPRCFIAWHLNVPIIFPIHSFRDGFSPSSGHSAAYAKSIYSNWRSVGANVWKMLPPPPRTTERLNRKIFKFGAKWKAARPLADGRQWRHAPYLHTSTRNKYGQLASPHYQSGNSISPPQKVTRPAADQWPEVTWLSTNHAPDENNKNGQATNDLALIEFDEIHLKPKENISSLRVEIRRVTNTSRRLFD